MTNCENVSAVAAEQFSLYHLDEQYHPIGIETSITLFSYIIAHFQRAMCFYIIILFVRLLIP